MHAGRGEGSRVERLLFIDPRSCTGCLECVKACAGRDGDSQNPAQARIYIEERRGRFLAHYCMQCRVAPCALVCPQDAIRFQPRMGYWEIDYDECIGCKACIVACPLGVMYLDPVADRVIKCDTCQGEPLCVAACPTGALAWIHPADRKAYLGRRAARG